MASPNGHPKANADSTPTRHIQQEASASPWTPPADSPSRQLFLELSIQTVNHTNEVHSKLDKEALERQKAYLDALRAAASEHQRVRRSAQRAQQLAELELESRRRKEEDDELKALDRGRQEKLEQEIARRRQAFEQTKRLAEKERLAAEAAAAAAAAAEEEEQRRRARQAKEEEEAAKRASEATNSQHRTGQMQGASKLTDSTPVNERASLSQPASSEPTRAPNQNDPEKLVLNPVLVQTPESREADHGRYLKLHQSLKELRKHVEAQGKSNGSLKTQIGEMRREIRKSVGQLTGELEARKIPLRKIRTVLNEALKVQQPSVDISPYIVSQALPQVEPSQRQVSGLLLYLLNIFSKQVISQFTEETGADSRTADPIGIVAISIFAASDFRWQGISLIDMLIAKFHVVCPVLFGIYGSEKTEAGRKRLGWRRDPDTGSWVSEQRHTERMTGLGSGFAALTLRNFQNSASRNPYPPSNYWRAVALILNTPPQQVTQTHCTVLRALIEQHVGRFISFYGSAAVAVIRRAVIEFPKEVPQTTASSVLATLASTLRRDFNLSL